jgi:2'-5' RNA ligase
MRKLYTVAFPTLADADARFVARIRARHDRQVSLLGPHFTLLFGCDAVDEAVYVDHVRAIAARTPAFAFRCQEAEPDADEGKGKGYVYLVPALGRDALTALHDALYTGPLAPFLRADLHFVPHITVGHGDDMAGAARLCDDLNATAIDVAGTIDALVVGCVEHGRFLELARFALRH